MIAGTIDEMTEEMLRECETFIHNTSDFLEKAIPLSDPTLKTTIEELKIKLTTLTRSLETAKISYNAEKSRAHNKNKH